MKNIIKSLSLLCLVNLLFAQLAYASSELPPIYFLEDSEHKFNIEQINSTPALGWQKADSGNFQFGITQSKYWLHFNVINSHHFHQQLIRLGNPRVDNVVVWFVANGEVIAKHQGGDNRSFTDRALLHHELVFTFPETEQSPLNIYIEATSSELFEMPVELHLWSDYLVSSNEMSLTLGIFVGFLTAMMISNFMLFLTTRSVNFLVYVAYVLSVGMLVASLQGLSFKFLWPDSLWLQSKAILIFANLSLIFAALFTRFILDTAKYSVSLNRGLHLLIGFLGLNLFLCLFLPFSSAIVMLLGLAFIAVSYLVTLGIILWRRGDSLALYYSFAWLVLLFSISLATLEALSVIKLTIASPFILATGATLEAIILSMVLALRYRNQIKDADAAHELALEHEISARESQNEMLKVQQQMQEELEYKVEERTFELEVTLRELAEKNQQLEEKNRLDALTGIKNRAFFNKKYQAEFRRSRREQSELAIVMLDIDHFKNVNDTYGHLVGDDCIRFVATTLKQHLKRPSDDACRYGGEEFALILPSTSAEGAQLVAENIRQFIENHPVPTPDIDVSLTISIGIVSQVVSADCDEHQLIDRADKALYSAKKNGRNQVALYQPS